ncbi:hypothetical protein GWK47_037370 [Chionoecetes opilio]|uniref:Uncharacterized protein n=1 Tax=Chionoecetes opilio TaxID=41210 RepID=A0A8J5CYQ3_CHIOP|nr:hypothetical protein GWK47_037370 [Chionoecetes opilio]
MFVVTSLTTPDYLLMLNMSSHFDLLISITPEAVNAGHKPIVTLISVCATTPPRGQGGRVPARGASITVAGTRVTVRPKALTVTACNAALACPAQTTQSSSLVLPQRGLCVIVTNLSSIVRSAAQRVAGASLAELSCDMNVLFARVELHAGHQASQATGGRTPTHPAPPPPPSSSYSTLSVPPPSQVLALSCTSQVFCLQLLLQHFKQSTSHLSIPHTTFLTQRALLGGHSSGSEGQTDNLTSKHTCTSSLFPHASEAHDPLGTVTQKQTL